MSKKIKRNKRSNVGQQVEDPNLEQDLEEVDEERAFEIEEDEETNEIVFVHHYRRKWGDDFDADVEHVMGPEEAMNMIGMVVQILDSIRARQLLYMAQKSTLKPIEGNPMQGPNNIDGV